MDYFFNKQSSRETMNEEARDAVSSSSEVSSIVSTESDLFEEVTSDGSSSTTLPSSTSVYSPSDPLHYMSSLLPPHPLKGLSKHYNGKSQSFTALSNVRCLEDLAKAENPYNKKLKSCKSYGELLSESHRSNHLSSSSSSSSRLISKKESSSRGSFSSFNNMKRTGSFLGNRPPVPPASHRSTSTTSFANQTTFFV